MSNPNLPATGDFVVKALSDRPDSYGVWEVIATWEQNGKPMMRLRLMDPPTGQEIELQRGPTCH